MPLSRRVLPYRFTKTIFSDFHGRLVATLRDARKQAGLTQVEAAEKVGCRQTFLSKIECGERRLDVFEFTVLCRAYGVSPGRFLERLLREFERNTRSDKRVVKPPAPKRA